MYLFNFIPACGYSKLPLMIESISALLHQIWFLRKACSSMVYQYTEIGPMYLLVFICNVLVFCNGPIILISSAFIFIFIINLADLHFFCISPTVQTSVGRIIMGSSNHARHLHHVCLCVSFNGGICVCGMIATMFSRTKTLFFNYFNLKITSATRPWLGLVPALLLPGKSSAVLRHAVTATSAVPAIQWWTHVAGRVAP